MRPRSRSWRRVAIWAVVILVATSVPVVDLATRVPLPGLDKLVHGAMYAVLGWLVGAALWMSGRRRRWAPLIALAAIAFFAAGDEMHQHWLPGRVPMLGDWVADVIGAAIGLIAATLTLRKVTAAEVQEHDALPTGRG